MKAIIPCAKKEDALYPFIESRPTGLMPVAGKSIIKHLISDLQELGVEDIYLVTNYLEDSYREEFDGYTNVNIVTQEDLNGTGGAVETCDFVEDDFLVVNGDVIISKEDVEKLLDKHSENEPDVTFLATDNSMPEKFGVLSIENDRVVKMEEKPEEPENTLVNTGIYVFKQEIFSVLEKMGGDEKSLTEAVQELVKDGGEARFELVDDYWIDIGSPKKLWKADSVKRNYLIEGKNIDEDAEIHEDSHINGNVEIEADVEIKPGTVIEGNVFIGKGSTIGPNTTVRDSSINSYSQVRSSDVEKSVLFEKAIVDPSSYVEDSILGEDTDMKSNSVIRESFIGPRSFIEVNNSIYGVKFVPDARTDLGEISK